MKSIYHSITIFFVTFLFTFDIYATHNELGDLNSEKEKPATIKVLIKQQVDGTLVEVKGPFKVYNPLNGKSLSSGSRGKRYFLYPHQDGLKWGEGYPGIYQICIVPTSPETTILVDGIEYRGSLECYHIDDFVSIVNEVDIETYIKSTLTASLRAAINETVMDALAIIERTNSYYTALKNTEAYWHVDAELVNYAGLASTLLNTNVDRAVDATRYLVMNFEENPFPATWTENCAGKTANFQSIFRKASHTPEGIDSPFAKETRAENHWCVLIPKEKLAKIAKTNRITGVDLFVDEVSKKVYAMRVKDGVHFQDLDFLNIQEALGENHLKSNDFTISIKDDMVHFEGFGQGHGVGLCIYSATCMADKGEQVPHFLGTFFPMTRLVFMRNLPDSFKENSKEIPSSKIIAEGG